MANKLQSPAASFAQSLQAPTISNPLNQFKAAPKPLPKTTKIYNPSVVEERKDIKT